MFYKCKACGQKIKQLRFNKHTGQEEELCIECLSESLQAALDIELEGEDPGDIVEILTQEYEKYV